MKLKPDDDVRNSESSIMTFTTVCKSELDKPIITQSDMGHKEKDSQPSVSEGSSPQTTATTQTTNKEGDDEVKSETVQVKTEESAPDGECTNDLASKDEDNTDDASVDTLVEGLKECRLAPESKAEVDSDAEEIIGGFVNLHLEVTDGKNEKKEVGVARRQEPEEDDEWEALRLKEEKPPSATETPESQDKKVQEIRMVKLEAPYKEEEEDDEESADEAETDALKERGPTSGIPVYHNYPRNQTVQLPQTFDFSVQDGIRRDLCDQNSWTFMPNTGNFNGQIMQGTHQHQAPQNSGSKRLINDLDFYDNEPPKFFRPQNDPQMTRINGYNNLDAPGQPNNNLKSINKVCHRQMSGGTVITHDNSLDLNATGLESLTNPLLQHQPDGLDCLEFPEFLSCQNFDSDSAPNDRVFDFEELLEGSGQIPDAQGCFPQDDFNAFQLQQQQQQLQNLNKQQQHHQQNFSQPVDMPLSHNFTMPVQNNLNYPQPQAQMGVGLLNQGLKKTCQRQMPAAQAQQQFQLENERSARLPPLQNAEDLGYSSDMSPTHEAQFPPTPSPMSVIHSPDPSGSSPPQQNWSPPPSNQSTMSQDSGSFSPKADVGEQQDDFDYVSHFVTENLPALEDALNVAREDLSRELQQSANYSHRTSHNIPSTVPQDITTSPSLQQSPEPLFRDVPSSTQTGKPVAVAVRRTNPKKPAPKAEVKNVPGKVNEGPAFNKIVVNQPVTTVGPAGTLMISSAAPLSQNSPPIVNNQGKVAIPPSRQKPCVTPVLPCFITPNGGITPFIVLSPGKPRFPPIAPKAPSKPAGSPEPAAASTYVKVTSPSVPGQNPKDTTTKRSGPSVKDKLNLARRSVAGLQTKDLMYSDPEGDTHLHVATVKTDECMIEAIMERLVRESRSHMVNAQNNMGQTPLYLAVCENKPEMVEVLVRYQADVKPFAEVMLDNGTREKSAAIHRASSKGEGHLRTLNELLKSPTIELDQMDAEGHTALHCAILSHGRVTFDNKVINSIPIIEALIGAGADPNLQVQKNGKTGLMFALESRNLELIESTFRLIDPVKLPTFLKTESFDGITCHRIASSIKSGLSTVNQQRLSKCLKPQATSRLDH